MIIHQGQIDLVTGNADSGWTISISDGSVVFVTDPYCRSFGPGENDSIYIEIEDGEIIRLLLNNIEVPEK